MSFADMGEPESGPGTQFCFCSTEPDNTSILQRIFSTPSGIGEIVESIEPNRVVIEIDWSFMDSRRTISLNETDEGMVEVNWREDFILGTPLLRYVPFFIGEIDFSPVLESVTELVD